MSYRITGLASEPFHHLYGLPDIALRKHGAIRMTVEEEPGYPDRITLREVPLGEQVLLVNHCSLSALTPYRATHAIFLWEGATERYDAVGRVPEVMRSRLLSLRGFDETDMMLVADVVEGERIEAVIERMFDNPAVAFIHVHNAKQGCFSGRVDRD